MPIEPVAGADLAARRILRLALGVTLALVISQAVAWPMSFLAPILVAVLLGLPLPLPRMVGGLKLLVVLIAPVALVALLLLPFITLYRDVAVILAVLGLFWSFLFSARGGSPVVGQLLTVGLAVVIAIGSVASALVPALVAGLAVGAGVAILIVWITHGVLPDPSLPPMKRPPAPAADPRQARLGALRALAVMLPVTLYVLFSPDSAAYMAVMIKGATLAQQASAEGHRTAARDLLASTAWGGAAAIAGFWLLGLWPSLGFFALIVALAALAFGRGMFRGPGPHPRAGMWSYALVTMLILLLPASADAPFGQAAGAAFWSRLWQFVLVTAYAGVAVRMFDALWPARPARRAAPGTAAS